MTTGTSSQRLLTSSKRIDPATAMASEMAMNFFSETVSERSMTGAKTAWKAAPTTETRVRTIPSRELDIPLPSRKFAAKPIVPQARARKRPLITAYWILRRALWDCMGTLSSVGHLFDYRRPTRGYVRPSG